MSIKRIETMTGTEVKKVIDTSHYSDHCDKCPLCDNDGFCYPGAGNCINCIVDWLYEDVDEDVNMLENMARVATCIHDMIISTVELSGFKISASDFAQMIANHIRKEENDG